MPGSKGNDTSGQDPVPKSFQISAPAIAMPKGGGAIRGIGEKFAANPVTGTGSLIIPIATSPGRSGFGPQVSLSYDSGGGNGPFGFGWTLSVTAITRKTEKGLPKYQDADESDVFLLSGVEDLVPEFQKDTDGNWIIKDGKHVILDNPRTVEGTSYRVRRYRPRIEGLFARIERWTNQSDESDVCWRSISKDNVTTWYGKTAESRVVDPMDPRRIFSWLLCESYDDKGNAIRYEYKPEDSADIDLSAVQEVNRNSAIRSVQRYLKCIKYGNKSPRKPNEVLARRTDWLFEAVFDYGEHYTEHTEGQPITVLQADQRPWLAREDPFSTYRSGFEVRTYRLCRHILIFHHFPDELGTNDYLVRATHFTYRQLPTGSFLTSTTQSGYIRNSDGTYLATSLPPVEFEYTEANIDETVREVDPVSLENLPQALDGNAYQWVDLDGEGLSGILTEQAGAWFYKRNQSALPVVDTTGKLVTVARFSALETVVTVPSPTGLNGGQQFLDLAGDGQLDVVEFGGPVPGFFERTPDNGWDTFTAFASLPNIAWNDPHLKFIDLTGDGHADILITEDGAFSWYPSLGEGGFGVGEKVGPAIDEERGPRLVFADSTQAIYVADMSGDGLTDLVRIRNGEVCYWPNLGYGRFGAKVDMGHAPLFDSSDQFDHKRIRLADIDGSGAVDILYLSGAGVHVYFNQSGNTWGARRTLHSFPCIDNLSSVTAVDLLGNGTACLVWSSPLPADGRSPMRYIDLMGGQKPHLLVTTRNNLGAETQITYSASTKFYLADKLAGMPWVTRLPFPVHCVEKVTVKDKWLQAEFSTTYSYHHGYFDGVEREFRGFGRVEQVDTERYQAFVQDNITSPFIADNRTLYQPPVKSVTWYHTGFAAERDRILAAFEQEYSAAAGFTEHKLPQPTLTPGDITADEWRDAARACKGMVLRREVFELDVDALEQGKHKPVRLFTTAYHNSHIQCLQPQGQNHHAVFLVTESEAISYHYELDLMDTAAVPDPRIAHTLTLRVDHYGRALQTIAVAYPRQGAHRDPLNILTQQQRELVQTVQGERHLAYTETRYTDELADDPDQHRLSVPCEVLTYELTGADATHGFNPSVGLYFSLEDLRAFTLSDVLPDQGGTPIIELEYHQQPRNETAHKRIIEWVRTLYFKDDLSGPQPFGRYAWLGLPYETYKLALTGNLLNAVFGTKLAADVVAQLNTPARSGYVSGIAMEGALADRYWIRSGIAGFASDAKDRFYLPDEYTDLFNNTTSLTYDGKYHLFIQSSADAQGNTTRVERFDYRVLAPTEIADINGNHTEMHFDMLGMVVASAVKGKQINGRWQGDDLIGFNEALANPSAADVVTFCTSSTVNDFQARLWLGHATARFIYHFGEQRDAQGRVTTWASRPAGACGILREIHFNSPGGATSPLQIGLECSDGSGNVLLKKMPAEPQPITGQERWIINGLTVLNNKGKPVKQYEPAFSDRFGCEMPQANGVTPILYYDSPGRLVRTEMPDGTLNRVEFTPWHVKTFDANDTVLEGDCAWYQHNGRNHLNPNGSLPTDLATGLPTATPDERAGWLASQHADTPALSILDSLGRDVVAIAHNRTADSDGVWRDDYGLTFTKLDAEGKPLWVRDSRGNLVMQYILPAKTNGDPSHAIPAGSVSCYDLAGNLLFQRSMDAGERWLLHDAAGQSFYAWDVNERRESNGTIVMEDRRFHTTYDALHRPLEEWLTVNGGIPQVIEQFGYGEGTASATQHNLRGRIREHLDQSGRKTVDNYDFKGNVLTVKRQLANRYKEPVVGWQPGSETAGVEHETFAQMAEYDALNRRTRLYNWHQGIGSRVAVYEPTYNQRGVLQSEDLIIRGLKTEAGYQEDDQSQRTTVITHVTYNARGQRERIEYGNGTITRYEYDPETFRLVQLRTTRPTYNPPFPSSRSQFKNNRVLQNLYYTYDPVGNVTEIEDDAYEPAFFDNQHVDSTSRYTYDALYRLIAATGRENGALTGAPAGIEHEAIAAHFPIQAADPNALRPYRQTYRYDSVGNMERMRHEAGNGSWTRDYADDSDDPARPASNRLWQTWEGGDRARAVTYAYDTHGNMQNLVNVAQAQYLRWDYRDMIREIDLGGGGRAYYNYDSGKQRTRKVIENHNGTKQWERINLGGFELYRRYVGGSLVEEIETHHLMDGSQRASYVEDVIRTDKSRLPIGPLHRYQYNNHLGSACLELSGDSEIISYEEYHPYGTAAYRAVNSAIEASSRRYRYTGMERDEESNLSYHGARHVVPWLARWCSCDLANTKIGDNVYAYVQLNPIGFTDPNGREEQWWAKAAMFAGGMLLYQAAGTVGAVQDIRQGARFLNQKLDDLADFVGNKSLENAERSMTALGITHPTMTGLVRQGAALQAAYSATGIKLLGGFLLLGPNLFLLPDAVMAIPSQLGGGASEVVEGVSAGDSDRALKGVANVAGGVGTAAGLIAGVGSFFKGGTQRVPMLEEVPPGGLRMPETLRIGVAEARLLAGDIFEQFPLLRQLRDIAANPTMEQVQGILNRFLTQENLGFERVQSGSLGVDNLASLTERPGVLQMTPEAFASPQTFLREVAHEMGARYTSQFMRELGLGRSELLWSPEVELPGIAPAMLRRWLNHFVDDITTGGTPPPQP